MATGPPCLPNTNEFMFAPQPCGCQRVTGAVVWEELTMPGKQGIYRVRAAFHSHDLVLHAGSLSPESVMGTTLSLTCL